MKPQRLVYTIALIASISLVFIFNYKIRLKNSELVAYQQLSRSAGKTMKVLSVKLAESNEKLVVYQQRVEELNTAIAILEVDNQDAKSQLQALKQEREQLSVQIAQLTQDNAQLEASLAVFTNTFNSAEKLVRVARFAAKQKRYQERLEKIKLSRELDKMRLEQGNKGFLVKAGNSTFRPKIKVEIEPLNKFSP